MQPIPGQKFKIADNALARIRQQPFGSKAVVEVARKGDIIQMQRRSMECSGSAGFIYHFVVERTGLSYSLTSTEFDHAWTEIMLTLEVNVTTGYIAAELAILRAEMQRLQTVRVLVA